MRSRCRAWALSGPGKKDGQKTRVKDASEGRMPVLSLTEGHQVSKGSGTGETASRESELKMLSEVGNLPP